MILKKLDYEHWAVCFPMPTKAHALKWAKNKDSYIVLIRKIK